jgi:hypothetical protein
MLIVLESNVLHVVALPKATELSDTESWVLKCKDVLMLMFCGNVSTVKMIRASKPFANRTIDCILLEKIDLHETCL